MGHSQADKLRSHERIVEIAAKRLRERGLEGIGVAELMKEAGLTIGGFYKHFDSRDDLVAEAIGSTFGTLQAQIEAGQESGKPLTFAKVIDDYLRPEHRDDPGSGCPFGALAADLARSDDKTRAIATAAIRQVIEQMAGLVDGGAPERTEPDGARERAITAYCAMIGAISLSRIVNDAALSDEILGSVARKLKEIVAA